MSKVKITNRAETPEEAKARELVEGIAQNITALAHTIRVLINGRLKKKALVILLAHASDLPQNKVEQMLTALENLDLEYTNKK